MDHIHFPNELKSMPEGLYLRIVHGHGRKECFMLVPLQDGVPCAYTCTADPGCLTICTEKGKIDFTYQDGATLLAQGSGVSLRLDMPISAYEYTAACPEGRYLVNTSACRTQFMLTPLAGTLLVDAPYDKQCCKYIHCDFLPGDDGVMRFSISHFEKVWEQRAAPGVFSDICSAWHEAFSSFSAQFPDCPDRYLETMQQALYVLWSAIVPPQGHVMRPGILMSNNWMTNIWTWDSAINAMGVSLGDATLAFDQLSTPFDHQHESGLLPDYINPHDIMWNFTKPPVHGLALQTMLKEKVTPALAAQLYEKLAKQVDFWLVYEDSDRDGIPQYGHGNDCGWDNCTPFEVGAPVEGPDLTAYLVLEMETLSILAHAIGKEEEAKQWGEKSAELLKRLLAHSWDGERFQVYQSSTHNISPRGDSLYPYLPLVLGHRLPPPVFQKLVQGLKEENRFLTPFGLATESIASPCYESDGYWRGPIWAPPMLFLIQGIADGGDAAFARLLADRFCDLMGKSGFAENFDALTGAPLRDAAYTWTASAFIVLACRYANKDA